MRRLQTVGIAKNSRRYINIDEQHNSFNVLAYSLTAVALLNTIWLFFSQSPANVSLLISFGVAIWFFLTALLKSISIKTRILSCLIALWIFSFAPTVLNGRIEVTLIGLVFLPIIAILFTGIEWGLVALLVTVLTGVATILMTTSSTLVSSIDNTWLFMLIEAFLLIASITFTVHHLLHNIRNNALSLSQTVTRLREENEVLAQQAAKLERRETQVRTAANIARQLNLELDPEIIFQRAVDTIKEQFNLYYVGIFIVDETGTYAELRAGSGEEGQQMVAQHHRLEVGGESMIGWATANRQPRIALDVGDEAVHFDNPMLPLTRSELALPMVVGDKVIGAMSVQSAMPNAFDQDDIVALQGIADSLAIAFQNAQLFNQLQSSLDEIQNLHRKYIQQSWGELIRGAEFSTTLEYVNPDAEESPQSTSVSVPLTVRGQEVGRIIIESNNPSLTDEERALLDAVSLQTASTLENIRLLNESLKQAQQNKIIANITNKVWEIQDVDEILQSALKELGDALEASDGLLQIDLAGENIKDR